MRRALLLSAILAVPALLAQAPSWDGDYAFDPERSDKLAETIKKATESLNFAMKPILRKKLEGSEKPAQTLSILKGASVTLTVEKNLPFTAAPGSPAKWKRSDGEAFDVACELQEGGFLLTFRQDDVARAQAFSLSPDGRTLTVEVILRNPRLPEPMKYRLVYRKAG